LGGTDVIEGVFLPERLPHKTTGANENDDQQQFQTEEPIAHRVAVDAHKESGLPFSNALRQERSIRLATHRSFRNTAFFIPLLSEYGGKESGAPNIGGLSQTHARLLGLPRSI
jgi:hypothetical protein